MMHRLIGVVVVLALGCGGSRRSHVPEPASGAMGSHESPAGRALQVEGPASNPTVSEETRKRVHHDWHRVYRGWSSLFVRDVGPYLITSDGAINLATGQVAFERDASNWTGHQGDTLWFADGFSPMSACPEPSTLAQLVGETLIPRFETNVHALLVRPWFKGSSIAAIVPRRAGPPWGYELAVLERNRTPPRAARRNARHAAECETRVAVLEALLAFPSGEVFVFGTECETQPSPELDNETDERAWSTPSQGYPPTVMESWRGERHEFTEMPFVELGLVEGAGPLDLWATGTVEDGRWGIAHYDGAGWRLLTERYPAPIDGLQVYDRETDYGARPLILTSGRVVEYRGEDRYEHELPAACGSEDAQVSGLVLDGRELWLECHEDGEPVLHTTRTGIAEVRFQTPEAERTTTTFTDEVYPRLDPGAPSLRSCGSGHFRELAPPESPLRINPGLDSDRPLD